jgi:hypothetical protein
MTKFLSSEELEAGLEYILQSPKDEGVLEMIVRRPEVNEREVLSKGELDLELGLIGDNWKNRGSSRTTDGFGHPEMQLNLMNSRVAALVAQSKERWKLAGDQLFVDLDLSRENLPPGTIMSIGDAAIEVTEIPHTGCKKFVERFGLEAMKFVNSEFGRANGFRGINAKVIKPGTIRVADSVEKVK